MKIVFDGQPLLEKNKTGISYYETGIIKAMLKKFPHNEYGVDIFTFKNRHEKKNMIAEQFSDLDIHECSWFSGTLYRMLSLYLPVPYSLFFRKKRTITHFCNYVVPFGVRGKKIVTIHDLAFREYPETIQKRTMLMLKRNLRKALKRADAIVTDSEFTRNEVLRYYDVPAERLHVVPCGVDMDQYHTGYGRRQIEVSKKKYNIDGEYFLYLGTLEPRKNLCGLLRAYKKFYDMVKGMGKTVPKLVLAGGKGWMYDEIFHTAEEILLKDHVIFTGYVDEEDKASLMCGALVFCFPSYYEGFGMPPLEAMACGTPVLTSNISALAEVTENAAVQVAPDDVEGMAAAMKELCDNNELRCRIRKCGLEQAAKYSWESAVEALNNVYEKLK